MRPTPVLRELVTNRYRLDGSTPWKSYFPPSTVYTTPRVARGANTRDRGGGGDGRARRSGTRRRNSSQWVNYFTGQSARRAEEAEFEVTPLAQDGGPDADTLDLHHEEGDTKPLPSTSHPPPRRTSRDAAAGEPGGTPPLTTPTSSSPPAAAEDARAPPSPAPAASPKMEDAPLVPAKPSFTDAWAHLAATHRRHEAPPEWGADSDGRGDAAGVAQRGWSREEDYLTASAHRFPQPADLHGGSTGAMMPGGEGAGDDGGWMGGPGPRTHGHDDPPGFTGGGGAAHANLADSVFPEDDAFGVIPEYNAAAAGGGSQPSSLFADAGNGADAFEAMVRARREAEARALRDDYLNDGFGSAAASLLREEADAYDAYGDGGGAGNDDDIDYDAMPGFRIPGAHDDEEGAATMGRGTPSAAAPPPPPPPAPRRPQYNLPGGMRGGGDAAGMVATAAAGRTPGAPAALQQHSRPGAVDAANAAPTAAAARARFEGMLQNRGIRGKASAASDAKPKRPSLITNTNPRAAGADAGAGAAPPTRRETYAERYPAVSALEGTEERRVRGWGDVDADHAGRGGSQAPRVEDAPAEREVALRATVDEDAVRALLEEAANPPHPIVLLKKLTEGGYQLSDAGLAALLRGLARELAQWGAGRTQEERAKLGGSVMSQVEDLSAPHHAGPLSASATLLCTACVPLPNQGLRFFETLIADGVLISSDAGNMFIRMLIAFDLQDQARTAALRAMQAGVILEPVVYERVIAQKNVHAPKERQRQRAKAEHIDLASMA